MTKVENMVKETERQEQRKVAVIDDKFSIETSVMFWRDYFNSATQEGGGQNLQKPNQ